MCECKWVCECVVVGVSVLLGDNVTLSGFVSVCECMWAGRVSRILSGILNGFVNGCVVGGGKCEWVYECECVGVTMWWMMM